jgi:hypothetical protein
MMQTLPENAENRNDVSVTVSLMEDVLRIEDGRKASEKRGFHARAANSARDVKLKRCRT